MSISALTLLNFHQFGDMPFSGREPEVSAIEQIVGKGNGFKLLNITGELGIGKKRVLDKALENLIKLHYSLKIIRVKYYELENKSIFDLLHTEILTHTTIDEVQAKYENGNRYDILTLIKNLSFYSCPIIILENKCNDLKKFFGEVYDLATLLNGISACVITISEYIPKGFINGLFSQFNNTTITIQPMDKPELVMLWNSIFGVYPQEDILQLAEKYSLGNPLAFKVILSTWLRVKAIYKKNEIHELAEPDLSILSGYAKEAIENFARGFTFALNRDEAKGLLVISKLGDLFSLESALFLLDGDKQLFHSLLIKGLIFESATPHISLVPTSNHDVYQITNRFIPLTNNSNYSLPMLRCMEFIASGLPIYSTTLIEYISNISKYQVDFLFGELAITTIRNIFMIQAKTSKIYRSLTFRKIIIKAIESIHSFSSTKLSYDENRETLGRVALLKGVQNMPTYNVARVIDANKNLDECVELTNNPNTPHIAKIRILAIANKITLTRSKFSSQPLRDSLLHEAIVVATKFNMIYSTQFFQVLVTYSNTIKPEQQVFLELKKYLQSLINEIDTSNTTDKEYKKKYLNYSIYGLLIDRFFSQTELLEYTNFLHNLKENSSYKLPVFYFTEMEFYLRSGDFTKLRKSSIYYSRMIQERSPDNRFSYFEGVLRSEFSLCANEYSFNDFHKSVLKIEVESGNIYIPSHFFILLAACLFSYEVNFDLIKDTDTYNNWHNWVENPMLSFFIFSVFYHKEQKNIFTPEVFAEFSFPDVFIASHELISKNERLIDEKLIENLFTILTDEPFSIESLFKFRATLFLLEHYTDTTLSFAEQAISGSNKCITWLEKFGLTNFISPFKFIINKYTMGNINKYTMGNKKINLHKKNQVTEKNSESKPTIKVWLCGNTKISIGEQKQKRLRSLRANLIAIMVLNQLVKNQYDKDRFYNLLKEMEITNNMTHTQLSKSGVYRLREIMGADAIITSLDFPPKLDFSLVQVDIIKANEFILSAEKNLKSQVYFKAIANTSDALNILSAGRLFADFDLSPFDYARTDIEIRLRHLVIELATKMIVLKNYDKNTESMLKKGVAYMPGDDELRDILVQVLKPQGRSSEIMYE